MKTLMAIELSLAILLSGSFAAYAQAEQRTVHRSHGAHHAVHRHVVGHNATPARGSERPGEAVETAPPAPLTSEMFKPYAHPGEGDDDGLSRDPDDCMKGCIGGDPQ